MEPRGPRPRYKIFEILFRYYFQLREETEEISECSIPAPEGVPLAQRLFLLHGIRNFVRDEANRKLYASPEDELQFFENYNNFIMYFHSGRSRQFVTAVLNPLVHDLSAVLTPNDVTKFPGLQTNLFHTQFE
jgi:hypothetical protein